MHFVSIATSCYSGTSLNIYSNWLQVLIVNPEAFFGLINLPNALKLDLRNLRQIYCDIAAVSEYSFSDKFAA
jgi:hypothetical protein